MAHKQTVPAHRQLKDDIVNLKDVFISYSRRNKDFAWQLNQALEAAGLSVWADWEDIPKGANWRAEIRAGIQGAGAFLLIISPDSLRSDEVRKEIEQAVEFQKRFVPVLHIEPEQSDYDTMPQAVSTHNWIFARASDDFPQAAQEIVTTVQTDLDHVRAHTRYTVRADEWQRADESSGRLLYNEEITRAEEWLQGALQKSPAPTEEIARFIRASRTHATQVQRRRLAIVSVLAVVATVFAIAAVLFAAEAERRRVLWVAAAAEAEQQRDIAQANEAEAVRQRIAAERAADEALSTSLALEAELALSDGQSALALRRALQANLLPDAPAAAPKALMEVLNNPGARHAFSDHDDFVIDVAISSDGSRVVSASHDRSAHIYDAITGQRLHTLADHPDFVMQVAFSPDDTQVYTFASNDTLRIWDVETGEQVGTIQTPRYVAIEDMQLSADGQMMLVLGCRRFDQNSQCVDSDMALWSVASSNIVQRFSADDVPVTRSAALSPDATRVLSGHSEGSLALWDVASGDLLTVLEGGDLAHTDAVLSVAYHPDGALALSGSTDFSIVVWDMTRNSALRKLNDHTGRVEALAFSADGTHFVSGSDDTTLRLWNTAELKPEALFRGHRAEIRSVALSDNGYTIASASEDGTVRVWATGASAFEQRRIDAPQGRVLGLALNASASRAYIGTLAGEVLITAVGTPRQYTVLAERNLGDEIVALALHPDETTFAAATTGAQDPDGLAYVYILDAETGETVTRLGGQPEAMRHLAYSPDGRHLAVASQDETVRIWDWQAETEAAVLVGHEYWVLGVAFSPDGERVLSAGANFDVIEWDWRDERIIHRLWQDGDPERAGHTSFVWRVAYHPTGQSALSVSDDQSIIWWDLQTGQQIAQYTDADGGHTAPVTAVAWLPDGRYFLTGSRDTALLLWDSETGQVVQRMVGHTDALWGLAIAPDGDAVFTSANDTTVREWLLLRTPAELVAFAAAARYAQPAAAAPPYNFAQAAVAAP